MEQRSKRNEGRREAKKKKLSREAKEKLAWAKSQRKRTRKN